VIGFKTKENVKYEDYPISVELKGIGSATAAKLSYKGDSNTDRIYLYHDSCALAERDEHIKSYLERLRILAKINVE